METPYSPYINRFLQPDSIVPNPTDPQGFNRYTYVGNNPLTYYDPGGHFKCKSNVESVSVEQCEKVIKKWLTALETNGGEDGKELAQEFRRIDEGDKVTIDVEGWTSPIAQYGTGNITNYFTVSSSIMNDTDGTHDLYNAATFGHEIVHLEQYNDKVAQLQTNVFPGTLVGEVNAYGVESNLFINMGLLGNQNLTAQERKNVRDVIEIGLYKYKSEEETLGSTWASQYYPNDPYLNLSQWTPLKYQNFRKDMMNYWLPPKKYHRGYLDPS